MNYFVNMQTKKPDKIPLRQPAICFIMLPGILKP